MPSSTRHGGCHCGAVRYHVDIDLSTPALSCNCSICVRAGALFSFVPADRFTLDQGEDNLTDYLFKNHVIHHLFCRTCGIKSFAHGTGPKGPMVAINVRCLDDIDLATIPTQPFDGKSL